MGKPDVGISEQEMLNKCIPQGEPQGKSPIPQKAGSLSNNSCKQDAPQQRMGARVKIYPPPSLFVISLSVSLSISLSLSLYLYIYLYMYIYAHVASLPTSECRMRVIPCMLKPHVGISHLETLSKCVPHGL